MPKTETIPDVPLDLIGPLLSIPQMSVGMSRSPQDGDSFTGFESHANGLGWIRTDVKPSGSIDSLGHDSLGGILSYKVSVPSSEVRGPAKASFIHQENIGRCCDLNRNLITCTVSDAIDENGTPSNDFPHTQVVEVRRRQVLDPGIARCLEDETSMQSPPETTRASVRTFN
jgi:hypothetical protein